MKCKFDNFSEHQFHIQPEFTFQFPKLCFIDDRNQVFWEGAFLPSLISTENTKPGPLNGVWTHIAIVGHYSKAGVPQGPQIITQIWWQHEAKSWRWNFHSFIPFVKRITLNMSSVDKRQHGTMCAFVDAVALAFSNIQRWRS